MVGDNLKALGLSEAGDGGALSVNATPGAALLASADPEVGDQRFRRCRDRSIPPSYLHKRENDSAPQKGAAANRESRLAIVMSLCGGILETDDGVNGGNGDGGAVGN